MAARAIDALRHARTVCDVRGSDRPRPDPPRRLRRRGPEGRRRRIGRRPPAAPAPQPSRRGDGRGARRRVRVAAHGLLCSAQAPRDNHPLPDAGGRFRGGVTEWSNVPVSKTGVALPLPRVRIPTPPPAARAGAPRRAGAAASRSAARSAACAASARRCASPALGRLAGAGIRTPSRASARCARLRSRSVFESSRVARGPRLPESGASAPRTLRARSGRATGVRAVLGARGAPAGDSVTTGRAGGTPRSGAATPTPDVRGARTAGRGRSATFVVASRARAHARDSFPRPRASRTLPASLTHPCGGMPERSNGRAWKARVRETVPRVRIPIPPPPARAPGPLARRPSRGTRRGELSDPGRRPVAAPRSVRGHRPGPDRNRVRGRAAERRGVRGATHRGRTPGRMG